MNVNGKHTKTFDSYKLSFRKFMAICMYAKHLREIKNDISQIINDDLLKYMNMSRMTFVTYFRHNYKRRDELKSSFDNQLYSDVYTAYSNRMDAIIKRISFYKVDFKGFEFYKRDSKKTNKKKGDLKSVKIEKVQTPLSRVLTYLARYGQDNTIERLKQSIEDENNKEEKNQSKIDFYQLIIDKCDKFGFERLYRLAKAKRERILSQYKNPIEFKSLTFRGKSRKKYIISPNTNTNSEIKAFISLSGIPGYDDYNIPVKICNRYHGKLKEYSKPVNEYEYRVIVDENQQSLKINLVKDAEVFYNDLCEVTEENTVGLDVNIKHNMFMCSDGSSYDYDRELVSKYTNLCSAIDECKKQGKEISKNKEKRLKHYRGLITSHTRETISCMCKDFQKKGYKYISMENLTGKFGKCYVESDEFSKLNYNRIISFLHISSLKDEVAHICRKYGMEVILVNSEYTSQRCHVCGCIHDENRETQEDFDCIECNHKENADLNAAKNIKFLAVDEIYRKKFLKLNQVGCSYMPKKMTHESITKHMKQLCRDTRKLRESCSEEIIEN